MPRSPYILVKTDDKLSKALRARSAKDHIIHSEYARMLCAIPLGVKNPALADAFAELEKRYPRITVAACLEAAWESYIRLATAHGIDGNFFPQLPDGMMPLKPIDPKNSKKDK